MKLLPPDVDPAEVLVVAVIAVVLTVAVLLILLGSKT